MNKALAPHRFHIHKLLKKRRLLCHKTPFGFKGDYFLRVNYPGKPISLQFQEESVSIPFEREWNLISHSMVKSKRIAITLNWTSKKPCPEESGSLTDFYLPKFILLRVSVRNTYSLFAGIPEPCKISQRSGRYP